MMVHSAVEMEIVNEQCNCTPTYTGTTCDTYYVAPPTCADVTTLSGSPLNCTSCLTYSQAYGINCVWCTTDSGNLTVNSTKTGYGSCIADTSCFTNALGTCAEIAPFTPPECPDNCSALGVCVNTSSCPELDANNTRDAGQYPLRCGSNYNQSVQLGFNSTCACFPGAQGYNCGSGTNFFAFASVIGAGVVAGIVIACVIAGAVVGGAAAAAVSQTTHETHHSVSHNPLYKPQTKSSVGLGAD